MKKIIDYFGSEKRFYLILIVLVLMWMGVMALFFLKADEVSKDPCGVCANKIGDEVVCSVGSSGMIRNRVYYPNFSIIDNPLYQP